MDIGLIDVDGHNFPNLALVRANLPEWCGVTITTMAQLMDCVAV